MHLDPLIAVVLTHIPIDSSLQGGGGEGGSVYPGGPDAGRTGPVAHSPPLGPPPVRATGGDPGPDHADVVGELCVGLGFVRFKVVIFYVFHCV